jgi:hypothetical protein
MASLSQQQSVGDQFAAAIYAMVQEVTAAGGQRKAYASTLALQQLWNENKSLLSGSGIIWFKLDEDGLWGANTGKAVKLLTGRDTPAHTEGLIQWGKDNKDLLDQFASSGPAPVAAPPAINSAPPAPWSPSATDLSLIGKMHGAVYLMMQEIGAAKGAAKAYSSVKLFQKIWNQSKGTVNHYSKAANLPFKWFKLTLDGKYGKNTAKALSFATSTKTPTHTYELGAWYAKNHTLVDSWAGDAQRLKGGSATSAIDSAKLTPNPAAVTQAAQSVADSARSGSLAQSNVPNEQPYQGQSSSLVSQYSYAGQASAAQQSSIGGDSIGSSYAQQGAYVSSQAVTPPQAIDDKIAVSQDIAKIAPQASDVDFSDETVVARRPASNITLYAVGAGLVAAAGVFALMARKGSRRRRAA